MDLRDKDLNMLVLFEKIWEERNLHRAAERLFISQPALSHALKRMREQFNDQLFVRSSTGVTPTDFAASIADDIKLLLQKTEALYEKGQGFVPEECDRTLFFAYGDYFSLTLLKDFFARLTKEAPLLKVICYPDSDIYTPRNFEQGLLHIGVTGFFDLELNQGFYKQVLVEDFVNCVARKNHPIFKTKMTLDDYLEYDHAFVSVEGTRYGMVDRVLSKKKKSRRVNHVVPSFAAAAELMEKTDIILTAPAAISASIARTHKLKTFDAPMPKIDFPVSMYWHTRTHEDPLLVWLRGLLRSVAADVKN